MSDENGGVYWTFVVARSSAFSRGRTPRRELDVLATDTEAAIVVDGLRSLRRIVASSCCFCSSGVIFDQRGTSRNLPRSDAVEQQASTTDGRRRRPRGEG
jgi:hypothetical protein